MEGEGVCPCCGSTRTASRRHLFLWLMGQAASPGPFAWYSEREPRALPPKSLAIIPGLLLLGMTLPMIGLWMLGHVVALKWLAFMALALAAGLAIDVFSTYRNYRLWGQQWLCADCREPFTTPAVTSQ